MILPGQYQKQFEEAFDAEKDQLEKTLKLRTSKEFEELGRFIHYHLIAEDALVRFIKSENPNIGDFEKGANQFSQKLIIAQNMKNSKRISAFNDPLQALNEIRNKFGHYPLVLDYPDKQMGRIKDFFEKRERDITGLSNIQVIEVLSTYFHTITSALITASKTIDIIEQDEKDFMMQTIARLLKDDD